MTPDIEQLSEALGDVLSARHWRLAVAESCTGGGISAAITDVAGSSAWFDRGYVTYSNQSKQDMLGVEADVLDAHGAVSEQVVRQMAEGARQRAAVELAVAVSGIAGPGGGTPEKPVGTVWLAWAAEGQDTRAQSFLFEGDRAGIRRQAIAAALAGLLDRLV